MNPAITLATARRVLSQLRHDHRTLAMLIVVPCVLLALLAWVFDGTTTFDAVGAPLLGMALGLLVSAFAATEFQAVQFMPAFVLPQFLLCGLLVPRDRMGDVLQTVSNALPLSYAVDAMRDLSLHEGVEPGAWGDLSVVGLSIVLALGLGAATLRRRTP